MTADELAADLADQTSASEGAALVGLYPHRTNLVGQTLASWVGGRIVSAKHFGISESAPSTDFTTQIKNAASSGLYVEFIEGEYQLTDAITMGTGGGFVGAGEKTIFRRNFTGGSSAGKPMIQHTSTSAIILRDFMLDNCNGVVGVHDDSFAQLRPVPCDRFRWCGHRRHNTVLE